MIIKNADYVISGVSSEQWPDWNLPEVCFVGKSNVGKSTFINTICQRKSLARTSSKPGKTRTLNFFNINEILGFVDVPGYGFAKVHKSILIQFGEMVDEYLKNRENLKVTFLLIDGRHGPTNDDLDMFNYLAHFGLNLYIVLTKWDKTNQKERNKVMKKTIDKLKISEKHIIKYSSETKLNVTKIWTIIKKDALGINENE